MDLYIDSVFTGQLAKARDCPFPEAVPRGADKRCGWSSGPRLAARGALKPTSLAPVLGAGRAGLLLTRRQAMALSLLGTVVLQPDPL